jgi:Fic family protein
MWQHDPTLHAPARNKRACRYAAFIPDALASLGLNLDGTVIGAVSEAESAIRRLNEEGGTALSPLARLLLRTESIASSKVEGMQMGVSELARAEARAETGKAPGPTATEVLANIDAMIVAVEDAAAAPVIGVDDILAIHRRLLEQTPQRHTAGKLRTVQNWIGGNDYNPCGADFIPPPPEDLGRLMTDLCDAMNDSTGSPLVQAALVHAQFETIHPFDDGNGRTGRALVHALLRRRNIAPGCMPPVSVVFAGARNRYIEGLTGFRGDDVSGWIAQFADAMLVAAGLARAYVHEVRRLQQSWRDRLQSTGTTTRSDAAAWAIIDMLPAHPIISAPVAAAITGRAKARVYEALESLTTARVLLPLSAGRRNQSWEAQGLLDIIANLEAGLPPVR